MLQSAFRSLFKYDRLVFEQGNFVLGATHSMWMVAAVVAAVALFVLWTYWSLTAVSGRDRWILLTVRGALLAVALFAVLRPVLLLRTAVPQQNFVGILLDDSSSMQIADEQGRPRAEFVRSQLGRAEAPLLADIGKRFVPRVFRFSSAAERLQSSADLSFAGTGTRLGDALDRARDELRGLPVAGLVLVTDGADNAEATLDDAIAGLKSEGVPVFTVGVGKERLTRDVEISRVETPRRTLRGTSLVVDVVLTQTGYRGVVVPLVVEESGRILSSQDVTLPPDGEAATVKVRFKAADAGVHTFRFRVPVQAGEQVAQNNQRDVAMEVESRREKILYVEGEPRFEPKFVRQATDKDDGLQVVLLMRTAEATVSSPDKFWRGGVDGPDELQNGFPTTREELFGYRGLIVGSIEAAAFTPDQQRMLEDFVSVRGGGLLALGGGRALGEGGWAGTPLSEALPVVLRRGEKPLSPPFELVVHPTQAGQTHPATQIADRDSDAAAKWKTLPTLTAVNAVSVADVKPGATALLTGNIGGGREQAVLAFQRYGRGKTLALPVQDTWLWRMHASMGVEDTTHQDFWRRLLRWVVEGVPDRVMVTAAPDRVQRGEPVVVTARVADAEYQPVNSGRVAVRVTSPSGHSEDVPMAWIVEKSGEYQARFTPTEDGIHTVTVTGATRAGLDIGVGTASVRVAPSDAEYFGAGMRAPLLRRIAEATNGRFFLAAETASLADAISYSGRGVTVVEERDLWDMPIVLYLLLALMGGEWLYRRSHGLA